jgi:DNA-binding response OmpR family regulator
VRGTTGYCSEPTMKIRERPTILLIEDDRATREMFDYALRMDGFAVLVASDGLGGLRLIEQDLPDLIVLDLDLPHVSGIDVQQEMMAHGETRAIPVVVVTGTDGKTPDGVFQILRKPITPDVLLEVVRKALSPQDET